MIDLRAPGVSPETFIVPSPAAGEWFVALAPRRDARLAAGDTDGVTGQAARLRRVLSPFAGLGDRVVMVAHDAAGHAALAAGNELPFVRTLVLAGTALTPVAFTILDDQPAADALRLLRRLLPPFDPAFSDDGDLEIGRALVDSLTTLLPLDDPSRDIRPPAAGIPTPRAGLEVHALFATIDAPMVARGMTAVVASGLAARARARAEVAHPPPTGVRLGIRLPFNAVVRPASPRRVTGWWSSLAWTDRTRGP